jgi:hypothetical protein
MYIVHIFSTLIYNSSKAKSLASQQDLVSVLFKGIFWGLSRTLFNSVSSFDPQITLCTRMQHGIEPRTVSTLALAVRHALLTGWFG